jgi:hypothetical protein
MGTSHHNFSSSAARLVAPALPAMRVPFTAVHAPNYSQYAISFSCISATHSPLKAPSEAADAVTDEPTAANHAAATA